MIQERDGGGGLLAPELSCFSCAQFIECVHPKSLPRRPYTMTNNGFQFEAILIQAEPGKVRVSKEEYESGHLYLCPLKCVRQFSRTHLLSLVLSSREDCSEEHLTRVCSDRLMYVRAADVQGDDKSCS